jgi:hypothetical protein
MFRPDGGRAQAEEHSEKELSLSTVREKEYRKFRN